MKRSGFPVASIAILVVLLGVVAVIAIFSSAKITKQSIADFRVANLSADFGSVVDLNNQNFDLDALLKDQTTVLTFWNGTCADCQNLLPKLRVAKFPSYVKKIYVHIGGDSKQVSQSIAEENLGIESYIDKDSRIYFAKQMAIPSTFVIENGVVKYYFPGKLSDDLLNELANYYQ